MKSNTPGTADRATTFVLPPDPWWLLRVPVTEGGSTPYHLWLWWTWQWCVPKELNA
jgi:hypothetical protein